MSPDRWTPPDGIWVPIKVAPAPELDCYTGPDGWTLPRTAPASGECPLMRQP
jgi:hypothetical protein